MPALCLPGESVSPVDLWKYRVVVTSYSYVAAEVTRTQRFIDGMVNYEQGRALQPPKRPMLVLLSGVLEQEPPKLVGEWLVLDEAHAIKNSESRTYHAISALRCHFNACLMMTGTPLDNKWDDGYALLSMLRGHPLTSFLLFKAAFFESLSSGPGHPEDYHKARFIQVLDAVSLRRPMSTITAAFPSLNQTVIVSFPLDPEDLQRSNHAFKRYKRAMRPLNGARRKGAGWKHLVTAHQCAYHRMLVELRFERHALERAMRRNEAVDTFEEGDQVATDQLIKWRKKLEDNENWLSRLVTVVLDVVDQHKDRYD
jgi:hypothetical protein